MDFLILGLSLALQISDEDAWKDLGQRTLIEKWQETARDPQSIEDFQHKYFLDEVGEETRARLEDKTSPQTPVSSQDVAVSRYIFERNLHERPWAIQDWTQAFMVYVKNILARPMDAANEAYFWWIRLWPPFLISLSLLLSFHLWLWSTALCKDLPGWLGSRSRFLIIVFLLSSFVGSLMVGFLDIYVFFLLVMAIIYSHQKTWFVSGAFAMALLFVISPFVSSGIHTLNQRAASEALIEGRTRLVYSEDNLAGLSPAEKAFWADLNGDTRSALHWLEKAPSTRETQMMKLHLNAGNTPVASLLEMYESLRREFGEDPSLLFNLSQLYIRNQKLLEADEIRNKLDPAFYTSSAQKITLLNRDFLPPSLSANSYTFEALSNRTAELFNQMGLSPLRLNPGLWTIIRWLLPFFFILLALSFRSGASGLCLHTGEPTKSPDVKTSLLYQSVMQKRENLHQSFRQQLDLLMRRNMIEQQNQVKLFSFIVPGASSYVFDQSFLSGLGLSFLVTFFFWNLFPDALIRSWASNMGIQAQYAWMSSGVSIAFILIFLITYFFSLWRNFQRAS